MGNKKIKADSSLYIVIGKTSRLMSNRLGKNLSEFNVTAEQWSVLASLWKNDGQTQQDLANAANKNKASITHLIDNLEKRNLVYRQSDEGDRRNNFIMLTEEGRNLKESLSKIVKKTTKEITSGIDKKDLKTSKKVLKKMIDNLVAE